MQNESFQKEEKDDLEKITVRVPVEIMDWVRARKEEHWWPKISHAFVWAMAQAMMREGYVFGKGRSDVRNRPDGDDREDSRPTDAAED